MKDIISKGDIAGGIGSFRTITPQARMNFSFARLIPDAVPSGSVLRWNDFSSNKKEGLITVIITTPHLSRI